MSWWKKEDDKGRGPSGGVGDAVVAFARTEMFIADICDVSNLLCKTANNPDDPNFQPGQCNQVSSCCWCCLVLFAVSNVDLQQSDDLYLNGWRLVGQIYIAYTYVTRCVNIHKDRMAAGASLPTELLSCGWNEPLLLVTNRMADVSYHLSMSKWGCQKISVLVSTGASPQKLSPLCAQSRKMRKPRGWSVNSGLEDWWENSYLPNDKITSLSTIHFIISMIR